MFELNVENYILQDALKIALNRYLSKNEIKVDVVKGKRGKVGECIDNSIREGKERVAIGFCVFQDESLINTIDIIIHSINYKDGKYIDNTDINEKYSFYLIGEYTNLNKVNLKEAMIIISKRYKKLAIKELKHIYEDIGLGSFNLKEV